MADDLVDGQGEHFDDARCVYEHAFDHQRDATCSLARVGRV
jgi:hypothetical protein